jgi:hypothetical protein
LRTRLSGAGTRSEQILDLLGDEVPPSGSCVGREEWREWRCRFRSHLERYGHAVYNLDFVNPVPADDPTPLFNTLRFYLRGLPPGASGQASVFGLMEMWAR